MKSTLAIIRIFSAAAMLALVAEGVLAEADSTPLAHSPVLTSTSNVQELRGQFDLSDGRILDVAPRGRDLVVTLGLQAPVRVKPTELANTFSSPDGKVRVEFSLRSNGIVDSVRVTHPSTPMAQAQPGLSAATRNAHIQSI